MSLRSVSLSLLPLVLLVVALGACGDDGEGDEDVVADAEPLVSDPLDPAAVAAELAVAWCEHRAVCEPVFATYLPETRAECEARLGASERQFFEAIAPLVIAGRVAFVRAELDRCLAAIAAGVADCARGVDPLACAGYVRGATPRGGACGASEECAAGLWCEGAPLGGCGECQRRARAGESCASDPCEPGFECVETGSGRKCVPVTADVGDACGEVSSGLCRGRLQCAGAGSRACVAPAGAGGVCDPTGAAADCDVFAGFVCGDGGTCAPIEVVAPPEACGETAVTHLCDSQSRCDSRAAACLALPVADEPCDASLPCARVYYCGSDLKCHALVAAGGSCAATVQCAEPLFCIEGACAPIAFGDCR